MRKLNTLDLIKTSTLLGKIGKDVEVTEGMSNAQIGLALFSSAMRHAETDVKELLASIAEMPVSEFEKMPFDYPIQLIEEIAEQEDLNGFLQRVRGLQNKLAKKQLTK